MVPGLVSWLHAENPFAAFSVPVPMPVIVAFGLLAIGVILWTLWRLPTDARVQGAALGTLFAGALGNLLDRLADGTVTDFVRVASWPIFNVADVAVACGVGLWVVHAATERERDVPAEGSKGDGA